jgi:hypothetical protein
MNRLIGFLLFLIFLPALSAGQDMKNFSFHIDGTSGAGTEGDITGLTLVGVTITGSTTSNRSVVFEVADSVGTYTQVKCIDIDTLAQSAGVTLSGATPHRYQCPVGGFKKFRVRISGGSTGTLTAVGLGLAKAQRPGGGGGGGGAGDALQSLPLSQFAPTTSAELSEVLTNETGTGSAVFNVSPELITPTGIVKGDVGLGNVDNTSDTTKNSAPGTLTNKTINFASNTVQSTLAQLNIALTDANVVPEVRTFNISGTSDEITCTGGAQDLSADRTWICSFSPIVDFNGQQVLLTRGTSVPPLCTMGQVFFNTTAPSGQNLYGCTSANIWTLLGDGTGAAGTVTISGSPTTGQATQWASATQITGVAVTGTGSYVKSTSPTLVTPLGIVKGDVGLANVDNTSDAVKNSAVATLTNKTIDLTNNVVQATLAQLNTALTDANIVPDVRSITVAGATDEIVCTGGTQDLSTNRTWTCSFAPITDFNGQQLVISRGTSLPVTCIVGQIFFNTTAPSGQNLYGCTVTDTWTLLGDGTGAAGSVTISGAPSTGQVAQFTSATQITGMPVTGTGSYVKATGATLSAPLGLVKGDVGLANVDNTSDAAKNSSAATLTSKTIDFSNNTILATLAQLNASLTDANVVPDIRTITVTGTTDEIVCTGGTQDLTSNRTWSCSFAAITDFNGQQLLLTRGASQPGSCIIGQVFFNTAAPVGQNLYGCTTTNGWTLLGGAGNALTSAPLSQFAPTTSAQLAGVITNETGTGALVFGTNPALVAPTGLVKGDVGLGNVDNTSDAVKNSTAATLLNKTIDFTNNTVLTTLSQLNTAITDGNVVPDTRTITVNGTTDEITCSGGTQDLQSNRTWTCSFAAVTDFNGQQLLLTRGTSRPPTCTIGQVFFDTAAPAGQNLYGCAATNVWSSLGGIVPFSSISSGTNVTGPLLVGTGSSLAASGSGTILATDVVGSANFALKTTTNQRISGTYVEPREVPYTPSGGAITPNLDSTGTVVIDALSVPLTINNPIGTGGYPKPGHELIFRIKSTTPQPLIWGLLYSAENGLPLPTTTSGVNNDWLKYIYNPTTAKYGLVATSLGVNRGVTTLASSITYTCPWNTSSLCEMVHTGAAGTLSMAQPTPTTGMINGMELRLAVMCDAGQTFAWNGIFVASPNVTLPASCPADPGHTRWLQLHAQWSDFITKWQVMSVNSGGASGFQPIQEVSGADAGSYSVLKFSNGSITNNGDGTATITTGGGGGTPGGSDTQAQYNNAGVFGGSSALLLNATDLTGVNAKATTMNANLTIGINDGPIITCTTAGTTRTATLPSASGTRGWFRLVKGDSAAGDCVLAPNGTDTFNGVAASKAAITKDSYIEVWKRSSTDWHAFVGVTSVSITSDVSGLGTNVAVFLAAPSSANAASALTDETGTGLVVFNNKPDLTVKDSTFIIQDDAANTKQLRFEASAITAGATRVATFPDADLTVVGTTTTQTLTGKSLALSGNTVTGTMAEFNTAISDANIFPDSGAVGIPNRTSATASTALTSSTVGQTLRVTGANAFAFGALDLANASAVTGLLPNASVDTDLAALGNATTTGLWTRTGSGTGSTRSVVGTGTNISVTNGDGVAGDPTIDVGANIAKLGTANAWADGIKQTFNPDATNAGVNVGGVTGNPSTLVNGDMWYNSTGNQLNARINGATVTLGAAALPTSINHSIYVPAGSMDVTGGCLLNDPNVLIAAGPKLPTITCTDNNADSIEFNWVSPDAWNAGTITIQLHAFNTAAETTALAMHFAGVCVSSGDAIAAHSTSGEVLATVTFTNATNREVWGVTPALTLQGTCAAGDHVYIRGQVDLTLTTVASMATVKILGAKVRYTNVGSLEFVP